jgi:muramoyltetrapeptide carboxypeptidase
MNRPAALKTKDLIGIAAPASPFDRKKFMHGVHVLEKLGFKVRFSSDIFDQNRYLAGTDERRARELTGLFVDKEVKAIMFARGGYGSQRIIPLLNSEIIGNNPKPVIGFSDITALLAYLRQNASVPTFYGPAITQLGSSPDGFTGEMLAAAISTSGPIGYAAMNGSYALNTGKAEGTFVGGCLSIINSSISTPYEMKTEASILFIEEINEKVYVLDRMLTQLKNSGKLESVRAVVFGSIIPPPDEPHDVVSMIQDVFKSFKGPIVMNYPAGHLDRFATLPLGVDASLDATDANHPRLTFLSGLLS